MANIPDELQDKDYVQLSSGHDANYDAYLVVEGSSVQVVRIAKSAPDDAGSDATPSDGNATDSGNGGGAPPWQG